MDKKTQIIVAVGAVVMLVAGFMLGKAAAAFWYTPQNTPLSTQGAIGATLAPPVTAPAQATTPTLVAAAPTQALTATPSPAPTLTATPTPKPICGAPPTMDILLIGSLRGFYDLADAIRIAHIDFTKPEVTVVTIPRDLLVKLPGGYPACSAQVNQSYFIKLNQAYFLGTPIMKAGAPTSGGADQLARTIAQYFGVSVDHYAVISNEGVWKIVDALGGIPVYIPEPIEDEATHLSLKPGNQVLDAHDFLLLLRYRGKQGDLFRIKNQNWYIKGFLDRIFSPQIITKWDDLIRLYGSLIMTDLSPSEISQLVCLGQHINPDDIHFVAPPEELFQLSEHKIYITCQPIVSSVLLWDDRLPRWIQEQLGVTP